MKTSLKVMLSSVSLTALFTTAAVAEDDSGFSGYATFTTDYRFRGISNSDRHPTVQGSINWTGGDGWYAGTWASGVDFNDAGATSVEVDLYGGKHIDLDGTDLNLEAYYYAYPDAASGSNYSYFEAIGGLSHEFDALTLGATVAWSPQFFGHTGNAVWVGGNASYAVTDFLSLSGNVGHQWINAGGDYTHWDVGGTFTWRQLALDVRYFDTDITCFSAGRDECKATVAASLTWNVPG